jgi:hypothetical protein
VHVLRRCFPGEEQRVQVRNAFQDGGLYRQPARVTTGPRHSRVRRRPFMRACDDLRARVRRRAG